MSGLTADPPPVGVAVLPAVRPARMAVDRRGVRAAERRPRWAPFAEDGEQAPDAAVAADMPFASAVVAGGAAVVASGATAEAAASDEPSASAEIVGRPVPYEPAPDDRWAVEAPGAGERSLPDAASDTEGVAGLVAATPDGDAIDDDAAAGALSAAASAERSSDVSADAPSGEAAAAPIAVPVRRRLRSDRLRMSQAHERSIALRRSTIAASLVLVAAIVIALAFVAARADSSAGEAVVRPPGSRWRQAVASTAPPTASTAPQTASATRPRVEPGPRHRRQRPCADRSATPGGFTTAQLAVLKPCPGRPTAGNAGSAGRQPPWRRSSSAFTTLLKANPQIPNPSLIPRRGR